MCSVSGRCCGRIWGVNWTLEVYIHFSWSEPFDSLWQVVAASSAAPVMGNTEACGIDAEHRGMRKFASPDKTEDNVVVSTLMEYCERGQTKVLQRWRRKRMCRLAIHRHIKDANPHSFWRPMTSLSVNACLALLVNQYQSTEVLPFAGTLLFNSQHKK